MNTSAEFILLHTTKYGEKSVVLHTLSKDYGRKGFIVKSISRSESMSLFQPLNILEAALAGGSSRSSLIPVRRVSLKHPLTGIRNSFPKNAISMFISEVIYRFIREGMPDPDLYAMCERNILLLDGLDRDFSNFHLRFLLEMSVTLGFGTEPDAIAPFAGESASVLRKFISLPFTESMLMPMTGETRNELAEILLKYIGFHMETTASVNSLKVLRELFCTSGPA